jgi:drug/metabolite transporter (DMT)-like permease
VTAPEIRSRPMLAAALALMGYAVFSGMDTVVKLLSARLPPVEILFFVSLLAPLPGVALAVARGRTWRLRPRSWGLQILRGFCMLIGAGSAFTSYAILPLADAYAIAFTQPLITALIAVPILHERIGWRRWAAIAFGFLGVLVVLRPGGGLAPLGVLAACLNALFVSAANVLIRRMDPRETAEACLLMHSLCVAVGCALALPWLWQAPTSGEVGLLLLAGVGNGVAFLLVIMAFQLAQAAFAAPFQYSQMLYAILAGLLVFGDQPSPGMLIGAAIVIASGLYILTDERRLRRAEAV